MYTQQRFRASQYGSQLKKKIKRRDPFYQLKAVFTSVCIAVVYFAQFAPVVLTKIQLAALALCAHRVELHLVTVRCAAVYESILVSLGVFRVVANIFAPLFETFGPVAIHLFFFYMSFSGVLGVCVFMRCEGSKQQWFCFVQKWE